jgi:hypothetical protein
VADEGIHRSFGISFSHRNHMQYDVRFKSPSRDR